MKEQPIKTGSLNCSAEK